MLNAFHSPTGSNISNKNVMPCLRYTTSPKHTQISHLQSPKVFTEDQEGGGGGRRRQGKKRIDELDELLHRVNCVCGAKRDYKRLFGLLLDTLEHNKRQKIRYKEAAREAQQREKQQEAQQQELMLQLKEFEEKSQDTIARMEDMQRQFAEREARVRSLDNEIKSKNEEITIKREEFNYLSTVLENMTEKMQLLERGERMQRSWQQVQHQKNSTANLQQSFVQSPVAQQYKSNFFENHGNQAQELHNYKNGNILRLNSPSNAQYTGVSDFKNNEIILQEEKESLRRQVYRMAAQLRKLEDEMLAEKNKNIQRENTFMPSSEQSLQQHELRQKQTSSNNARSQPLHTPQQDPAYSNEEQEYTEQDLQYPLPEEVNNGSESENIYNVEDNQTNTQKSEDDDDVQKIIMQHRIDQELRNYRQK